MDSNQQRFRFDGKGGELFGIYIVNMLLTVVTLGIYSFWARVRTLKFLYQHIDFMGERFDYHGTGREQFIGFLKGLAVVVGFLVGVGILNFALAAIIGKTAASVVSMVVLYGTALVATPYLLIGSQRYQLSRTSWRGLRFNFVGTPKELTVEFVKGALLCALTLGIYSPWFMCDMRRFFTDNSQYGDTAFRFDGKGGELFKIYIVGFLLSAVTLGIYSFWWAAEMNRYFTRHTSFQGHRFQSELTGGALLKVTLLSTLLVIVTLGFGFPWAIIMRLEVVLHAITLEGHVNLNAVLPATDRTANAFADGVGDAAAMFG